MVTAFAGMVIAYAGEINDTGGIVEVPTAGSGWLLCNGAALSSAAYPALFTAIQAAHGNGSDDASPSTNFNLPDYRGLFLRGVAGSRTDRDPNSMDADRPQNHSGGNVGNRVGSVQTDAIGPHNHPLQQRIIGDTRGGFRNTFAAGSEAGSIWDIGIYNTENNKGTETRPKNANVHWIICTGP